MIKKIFSVMLIIAGSLAVLFAQVQLNRLVQQPYNGKKSPSVDLSEAYNLALAALGKDTNQFYCVRTTCLDQLPGVTSNSGGHGGGDGWTFEFSSTNGIQKQVLVYFDKATWIGPVATTKGGGLF